MRTVGYPGDVANTLANADAVAATGELVADGGDLRELIGRPTTTLAQAVAALADTGSST